MTKKENHTQNQKPQTHKKNYFSLFKLPSYQALFHNPSLDGLLPKCQYTADSSQTHVYRISVKSPDLLHSALDRGYPI